MQSINHFSISFIISGFLFWFTNSFIACIAALAAGVLVDIDHLFPDYIFHLQKKRESFSLNHFFTTCEKNLLYKCYLILHAYEWIVLIWVVFAINSKNLLILGIAVGLTQHLFLDVITNPVELRGYSIIYRALTHFDPKSILKQ
ncbi:MAG: hypothetical protein P9M03_01955 [Candidatus Theseobacter exili]|nr:hypothetical protein [Candidatus Theseobacter exili]